MFDYISAIYHGEPIHTHAQCPLDDQEATLFHLMGQVRQEMGKPFADELDDHIRAEINVGREWAFRDGFRLGGQLMLSVLDGEP